MWGDQLAWRWRIIRKIEASPEGLTVAEIAKRLKTERRTICSYLGALQAAGLPLRTKRVEKANHWAFIGTFEFKTTPPFTLTELTSLFFLKDVVRVLKGTPFYNSLESVFKKVQSIENNLWEMDGELCIQNRHGWK